MTTKKKKPIKKLPIIFSEQEEKDMVARFAEESALHVRQVQAIEKLTLAAAEIITLLEKRSEDVVMALSNITRGLDTIRAEAERIRAQS